MAPVGLLWLWGRISPGNRLQVAVSHLPALGIAVGSWHLGRMDEGFSLRRLQKFLESPHRWRIVLRREWGGVRDLLSDIWTYDLSDWFFPMLAFSAVFYVFAYYLLEPMIYAWAALIAVAIAGFALFLVGRIGFLVVRRVRGQEAYDRLVAIWLNDILEPLLDKIYFLVNREHRETKPPNVQPGESPERKHDVDAGQ